MPGTAEMVAHNTPIEGAGGPTPPEEGKEGGREGGKRGKTTNLSPDPHPRPAKNPKPPKLQKALKGP